MHEWADIALLQEYAERGTEEAFALLVTRHINRVYSVALRHTKNPHQAEEISQTVFIILARKAGQLGKKVILEGWLYQTARLTALTALRSDIRRAQREKESQMQNLTNENESQVWEQIEPLFDSAMGSLNEADRHAVVLRYFYGKSMREVGAAMGGTEGAATLRLHRALEKLRRFFLRHGVNSTAAAIGAAIFANSAQAAPPALAGSVTSAALAKGVAVGGTAPALANSVMKLIAWAQVKFAIGMGAAVLLLAAGGTEIYAVHKSSAQKVSQKHFPRSGWANDGFATPEATLNTYFWSQSTGDAKVFCDASTKPVLEFMTNMIFRNRDGKSPSEVLVARVKDFQGVTVDRKLAFPDGRVLFKLSVDGMPDATGAMTMILTNSEGDWKIALLRQFLGSAYKEYPMPIPLTEADIAPREGSELQGYWVGAIHTPRGDSKINLKLAEPLDEFYRAEFYNVEQASMRPALITRDGVNVTFRLMWAVGTFEGKLLKDGTTLEGKWIQGSRELPATLTRTNGAKP